MDKLQKQIARLDKLAQEISNATDNQEVSRIVSESHEILEDAYDAFKEFIRANKGRRQAARNDWDYEGLFKGKENPPGSETKHQWHEITIKVNKKTLARGVATFAKLLRLHSDKNQRGSLLNTLLQHGEGEQYEQAAYKLNMVLVRLRRYFRLASGGTVHPPEMEGWGKKASLSKGTRHYLEAVAKIAEKHPELKRAAAEIRALINAKSK